MTEPKKTLYDMGACMVWPSALQSLAEVRKRLPKDIHAAFDNALLEWVADDAIDAINRSLITS